MTLMHYPISIITTSLKRQLFFHCKNISYFQCYFCTIKYSVRLTMYTENSKIIVILISHLEARRIKLETFKLPKNEFTVFVFNITCFRTNSIFKNSLCKAQADVQFLRNSPNSYLEKKTIYMPTFIPSQSLLKEFIQSNGDHKSV